MSKVIEAALAKGFEHGFDQFVKAFSGPNVNQVMRGVQQTINKSFNTSTATTGAKALTKSLNGASQEAYNLSEALGRIGRLEKEVAAAQYRARSEERQASITARDRFNRDAQFRIETLKGENSRAASAAQGLAQQQVVSARYAGKQRVLVTQEVLRTIGRLEKALGATLAGTARTATSAISRTFSALGSALRRNNTEFTQGLSTSLNRRETIMRESFSNQEKIVRNSVIRQERQLNELRTAASRGVAGAVTGRGVGVGIGAVAGGAGLLGLLSAGFSRFSDLERINKQFLALTGNISDTNLLMEQVKQFAKETPFDLVGVADLAKGFLAIKTPVDQVLPRVQAIADAVALTGGGVDQLNGVQRALGQIVSAGRLQGDELNQLAENLPGLNIRQILADQLTNGDVPALIALQEAGELSADAVVNGLITGLATDERLKGASGDLAKTLGGRVANLKESFADFGAAIIGTVVVPLKAAVTITQTALQSMSDFIKGENLGPILTLVRDAAKGAAIGIAALGVAKGAAEAVKLLALSAKLLLSPFGLLVVGVGLVGAAISVLMGRSEPLRLAISKLGVYLEAIGNIIVALVQPALDAVTRFIDEKAIPAVTRFADYIGTHLLGALDATIAFVRNTAIPAIVGLAKVVGETAVTAFTFLTEKAKAFFGFVRPFIQPAIEGFHQLANAIGAAFGGDFSGLRDGAANAIAGVATTVATIAASVGEALLPVGQKVLGFFTKLSSPENVSKFAGAFLDVVEQIGFIIGNIISDPLVFKVAAGLAAAGVVLAFRLLKGFAEGIISNIPELASLIGDALGSALELAFDNIGKVILVGTALALAGPKLFRLFTAFGQGGGKAMVAGFGSSLSGLSLASAKAFFGGPNGFVSLAKTNGQTAAKEMIREFNRNNNLLTTGGQSAISKQGFFVSPKNLEDSRAAVVKLKNSLGEAGTKALELRNRMNENVAFIRGSAGVIRGIGDNFAHATATGATGFTRLRDTFKLVMTDLRAVASAQGTTIGQALGTALRSAASTAVAGVGGFLAGKSAGESGGNVGLTTLTAGLTGLAVGGPVVGAVAAGASLIGAAFGAAGAKAKEFKENVKQLASGLKDDLTNAVEKGAISLDKLKAGLIGFGDVAGLDSLAATFKDELGGDGVKALDAFGLSFADNLLPIIRQGGDLDVMKDKLRTAFLTAATSSAEFSDRFGDSASKIAGLISDLIKPGGGSSFEDLLTSITTLDGDNSIENLVRNNEPFVKDLINTSGDLTRAVEVTKGALEDLNSSSRVFGTGITPPKLTTSNIETSFDTVDARLKESTLLAELAYEQLNKVFNPSTGTQVVQAQAISTAANLGSQSQSIIDGGGTDSVKQANQVLNRDDLTKVINDALAGAGDGVVFDEASATAYVQPIIDAYLSAFNDPNVTAFVKADLEKNLPSLFPAFDNVKTSEAAKEMNERVNAYLKDHPSLVNVDPDVVGALEAGVQLRQGYVQAVEAGPAPKPPGIDKKKVKDDGKEAGSNMGTGFVEGITGKLAAVAAAAAALAQKATTTAKYNLKISSPSKVFREIGSNVGLSLALGVDDTAEEVTSKVADLVDKIVKAAKGGLSNAQSAMQQLGSQLFGAMTGSGGALNTGSALNAVKTGVVNAIQSVVTNFESQFGQLASIGSKIGEGGTPSASESNLFNELQAGGLFSLDPNSLLGGANLASLTSAFDAIAELGQTLLDQGNDAGTVADELNKQVAALVATATKLGFNSTDILALADALGLSTEALAEFVDQLKNVQTVEQTAPERQTLPNYITNKIYLPTGDPQAAAMAVANRQASWVFG